MASFSPAAPLFSDLRGVTVRNTFLEFEDTGKNDMLPESGFTRQASEPAKPFNRQVSEQTTTGSGATLEESSGAEPDEGYAQLAAYLGATMPQANMGDFMRGGGNSGQVGRHDPSVMQAAFQVASATGVTAVAAPAPVQQQFPMARFCPNCGSEAEPNHRFCPYCCFQLQQPFAASGGMQQGAMQKSAAPVNGEAGLTVSPSAPNLLSYLRRFRYVEAAQRDVELARVVCLNYMQTGMAN